MTCRSLGSQTRIGGLLGGSNAPGRDLLALGAVCIASKSASSKFPYISSLREAAWLLDSIGYV